MSKCPNSWFGKHKYQGRYDEVPSDYFRKINTEGLFSDEVVALMRASILRKYTCDVCVHCGDKIVR